MKLGRSEQTSHLASNESWCEAALGPHWMSHESSPRTNTFSLTVFLADSKWEDILAGQIIPPLQQNNPPSPKGPPELGTSGFFGFLR